MRISACLRLCTPALAVATLVSVAGCGPEYDPLTREGLWTADHSNRANLLMEAANPSDVTFGKAATGSDGQLAAAAVERLRIGKVKKLPDSGVSQISVSSGGSSADSSSATSSSQ
jgi:hypothetical protein